VIGYVGGIFKEMFLDFDFALPTTTKWLFWCRDVGVWLAAGVLVIGLCAVFLVRLRAGSAGWQRLVAATPFAGQLWRWLGVAEWSSLLSVLIENQVPLPEALRLAADGIRNADLGQLSLRFAVGAEKGESLSAMLQATPQAPASLAPLIRWGEKTNMLAEALETGRQMFEKRVQARSLLLNAVLPPILLVVIGGFVLFVVGSLFSPMLDLIRGLSG
jgi:type II secretory pathway component PulF